MVCGHHKGSGYGQHARHRMIIDDNGAVSMATVVDTAPTLHTWQASLHIRP
jgi:hypothetical protein